LNIKSLNSKRVSFRAPRRTTIALLMAGGIFLWGCSKTQDTAPETRIFGSPPTIQNVALESGGSTGVATCDFTDYFKSFLCLGGLPSDQISPFPTITIETHYTEARFDVTVTDPESTSAASDILLVSASYVTTTAPKSEVSLVVLDDGSSNKFVYNQQGTEPEFCDPAYCSTTCDPTRCSCILAHYDLTSNDTTANDSVFTRGFAIVSGNMQLTSPTGVTVGNKGDFARNCIARSKQQFPAFVDVPLGSSVEFKVEAVDKEGNLTTWPTKPAATFNQTTYRCLGDDCACCIMLSNQPNECHGKPGMTGVPGSGFEDGFCNHV